MPVGAYDPWIRVHCNPEQAIDMAFLLAELLKKVRSAQAKPMPAVAGL